jgi:hypothetical protein
MKQVLLKKFFKKLDADFIDLKKKVKQLTVATEISNGDTMKAWVGLHLVSSTLLCGPLTSSNKVVTWVTEVSHQANPSFHLQQEVVRIFEPHSFLGIPIIMMHPF